MMGSIARKMTLMLVSAATLTVVAADPEPDHALTLYTQSRVADPSSSGSFTIAYKTIRWDAHKTAVVICDMWARHWCDGACKRGAEMAPRMNEFVKEARRRGSLIVHAPSGGMEHYAGHPARKRAQSAPRAANLPEGVGAGCQGIEAEKQGEWPIDQADGGCDDQPRCPNRPMDRHQTSAIEIHDEDAITDSGVECWNLYEQRGIENVILVGVHTNMCVIGRPFGLRNMVRFGKRVLLVRDLTDTMYNPRCRPFVPHVRGTELIIEHIEKYVCPTITSVDLLGGKANRFAEDNRPHVAFLVSDDHYHADKTLPAFAQMLRERFGCHCTVMHGQGTCDIPATSELEGVDCLVVYVRRLALPKEQLDRVRKYADSGKPLVGLRTASHAFSLLGKIEAGQAEWPEFDAQVLGGNYHGHAGNKLGTDVAIVAEQSAHPLLAGVEPTRWHSTSSLYFTSPVAANSTVVMTGATGDRTEPLTWTRTHRGGRVVYLGLGDPDDFKVPQFRRLLVNAIFWAMDRPCRWSLFNGENLDGWVIECRPQDNDKRGYWKVEKGTITAETAPGGKHHYIWLLTEKEYGDFELRAKVQTYSTSTGNSGIQVRSRYDKEAGWLDGPQVDINPPGPWRCGFIYDETRGAQVWLWPDVGRPANAKPEHAPPGWKWRHADKEDVWNDVHIACQGKRIKTVINGVTVADYDGTGRLDDEAHRVRNVGLKGHIGLQIHPGNELLIRFKDIELRELE